MSTIQPKLDELARGVRLSTGEHHRVVVERATVRRLEVEDAFFHTGSAVLLPDAPLGDGDGSGEAREVAFANQALWRDLEASHPTYARALRETRYQPDGRGRLDGVTLLATALRHLEKNVSQKLLVAGHTDRAGSPSTNQALSDARWKATVAALEGKRSDFVSACRDRHVREDDASYLRYAADTWGWPCELSGPVAGKEEVRAFQRRYNEVFGAHIAEDGAVGPETLGAFFDLLETDLAEAVGGTDTLRSLRQSLRFVSSGHKGMGFGERFPIEAPDRDGYRSALNRRVEVLFFEGASAPDLGDAGKAGLLIYRRLRYRFVPLEPDASRPAGPARTFEATDAEPRPGVGEPAEALETAMAEVRTARDPHDPWAFLEPLDQARSFGSREDRASTGSGSRSGAGGGAPTLA